METGGCQEKLYATVCLYECIFVAAFVMGFFSPRMKSLDVAGCSFFCQPKTKFVSSRRHNERGRARGESPDHRFHSCPLPPLRYQGFGLFGSAFLVFVYWC